MCKSITVILFLFLILRMYAKEMSLCVHVESVESGSEMSASNAIDSSCQFACSGLESMSLSV